MVYILDLFEGRLSLTDVLEGDMFIITAMREAKEKQIERRNKAVKRSMPKNSATPLTPISEDQSDRGGFLGPISNIR